MSGTYLTLNSLRLDLYIFEYLLLFTSKLFLFLSSEKAKAAKPSGTLHWMQERLKVGFWVDKYQDHKEKKKEKRRLKAEEQYAQWTTYKNSCANYAGRPTQQPDCYLDRSAKRNSILKSIF